MMDELFSTHAFSQKMQ